MKFRILSEYYVENGLGIALADYTAFLNVNVAQSLTSTASLHIGRFLQQILIRCAVTAQQT